MTGSLPDNFHQVEQDHTFCFACHPGVPCFTECCRQLDLALTPYDILRLKNRLGMHSDSFLERYVIIEWDERIVFPQCYLTMVDDGRASCVFVTQEGCKVYSDRPGACRAYPVGRGVSRQAGEEHYVLVKEPHCQGFNEPTSQTPLHYLRDQDLNEYSRFDDAILSILQHEKVRQGFRLSHPQLDQFILGLYNLDQFRQEMNGGRIAMRRPLASSELRGLAGNEEDLLLLGINWLKQELFGE